MSHLLPCLLTPRVDGQIGNSFHVGLNGNSKLISVSILLTKLQHHHQTIQRVPLSGLWS